MQNATREMLCKTFSSAADRADEERFPENSWITSLRKENEVRAQKNHLVLDQQKIGFPITYQANSLTASCIRNEGKKSIAAYSPKF